MRMYLPSFSFFVLTRPPLATQDVNATGTSTLYEVNAYGVSDYRACMAHEVHVCSYYCPNLGHHLRKGKGKVKSNGKGHGEKRRERKAWRDRPWVPAAGQWWRAASSGVRVIAMCTLM